MKAKIVKPTEQDIHTVYRFLELCEFLFTEGSSFEDLDDTDPVKILYDKITRDIYDTEIDIENPDEVRLEVIRRIFLNCSGRWIKVMNAAVILADQICDPSVGYVELHPFFKRANQNTMLGE